MDAFAAQPPKVEVTVENGHVRLKGQKIEPIALDDSMVVPSLLELPQSFVSLKAGHFLGVTREDAAKDVFLHPGDYILRVKYRSLVPSRFGKGENFIALEDGWIESESVHIHVAG